MTLPTGTISRSVKHKVGCHWRQAQMMADEIETLLSARLRRNCALLQALGKHLLPAHDAFAFKSAGYDDESDPATGRSEALRW
jgi:hypothetical protein